MAKEIIEELIGDMSNPKKTILSKNRYIARFLDKNTDKAGFERFFPIDPVLIYSNKNFSSGVNNHSVRFGYDGPQYITLSEEWVDDFTNEIIKSSIEFSLPQMDDLNLSTFKEVDKKKYRDYIFIKMKEISELSINNINFWLKLVGIEIDYVDLSYFSKKDKEEITLLRVSSSCSSPCTSCFIDGKEIPFSKMKKGRTITKSVSYTYASYTYWDDNHNSYDLLSQQFIMHKIFNCLPVEGFEYQLLTDNYNDPNFTWKDIYDKIWGNMQSAEGLNFCGFIKKFTNTEFSCFHDYIYTKPNNILSDGRIESHVAQNINDDSDEEIN